MVQITGTTSDFKMGVIISVIWFIFLDVNECLNNPCDQNALCTNTKGSFSCSCKEGFTGNGTYCRGNFVQLSIGSLFRFALFYRQKNLIFITMFGAVLRNEPIRVNIR